VKLAAGFILRCAVQNTTLSLLDTPSLTTGKPYAILNPSLRGARSSMAERLTVDQEVAGSKPVGHPILTPNYRLTSFLPSLALFGRVRLWISICIRRAAILASVAQQ
jgi:hypothetical protein